MMEFTAPKLRQEIKTYVNTVKLPPSKQELWDVQLRNCPESVELPAQQMFRWADGPGEARAEALVAVGGEDGVEVGAQRG